MADEMIYFNDLTHSIEVPSGFALHEMGHAGAIQGISPICGVAVEEQPKEHIAIIKSFICL